MNDPMTDNDKALALLRKWRYAPGNYSCHCFECNGDFQGDKRATTCRPCAEKLEARALATDQAALPKGQESGLLYDDTQPVHAALADVVKDGYATDGQRAAARAGLALIEALQAQLSALRRDTVAECAKRAGHFLMVKSALEVQTIVDLEEHIRALPDATAAKEGGR